MLFHLYISHIVTGYGQSWLYVPLTSSSDTDSLKSVEQVFVVVLLETAMILFNIIKIYLDIILKSALEVSKPIGETVGIQESEFIMICNLNTVTEPYIHGVFSGSKSLPPYYLIYILPLFRRYSYNGLSTVAHSEVLLIYYSLVPHLYNCSTLFLVESQCLVFTSDPPRTHCSRLSLLTW